MSRDLLLRTRRLLGGALVLAAGLVTLLDVGCSLPHPPPRAICQVAVRPLGSAGEPIGPSQVLRTSAPTLRATQVVACTEPAAADAVRRWDDSLARSQGSICAATDATSAALRSLVCPAGTTGWCKVPGSLTCFARSDPGDSSCGTPPTAALPDCPAVPVPPGMPRLCVGPTDRSFDLGRVPVGSVFNAVVRLTNCGGGRLVVPPPGSIQAEPNSIGSFPPPSWTCASLSPEEMTAMGAFLGTTDRPECNLMIPFIPDSGGPKQATFTYAVPGFDPLTFTLAGIGVPGHLDLSFVEPPTHGGTARLCFRAAPVVSVPGPGGARSCRERSFRVRVSTAVVTFRAPQGDARYSELTVVPSIPLGPGADATVVVRDCDLSRPVTEGLVTLPTNAEEPSLTLEIGDC
ncbi:MAG: hypothetical protein U0002_03345 [Thermoanaerobaculia bacterium]